MIDETKIIEFYQKMVTSKDDPHLPAGKSFIIEEGVIACPWCGNKRVTIRAKRGGMFSEAANPAKCDHAAQCTVCQAWGPSCGNGESIRDTMLKWNCRWFSWRGRICRIRWWFHYRKVHLKYWVKDLLKRI